MRYPLAPILLLALSAFAVSVQTAQHVQGQIPFEVTLSMESSTFDLGGEDPVSETITVTVSAPSFSQITVTLSLEDTGLGLPHSFTPQRLVFDGPGVANATLTIRIPGPETRGGPHDVAVRGHWQSLTGVSGVEEVPATVVIPERHGFIFTASDLCIPVGGKGNVYFLLTNTGNVDEEILVELIDPNKLANLGVAVEPTSVTVVLQPQGTENVSMEVRAGSTPADVTLRARARSPNAASEQAFQLRIRLEEGSDAEDRSGISNGGGPYGDQVMTYAAAGVGVILLLIVLLVILRYRGA